MILTCPECATSYFVDDLRIPRLGRMVKCTTCGNRWRAFQDRHEPEKEAPEDDLVVEGPPPEPPPDDEIDFVATPPAPARRPPPEKKGPSRGVIIASSAIVAVGLIGGAVVLLRQQIADLLPATAPMFTAIGLPVDTLGLVFEGVKSKAMLQAGRPVWSITGAVRNVRDEPVSAPPLRLALLDKDGKELAILTADALNARVPPGALRYFAITLPDPPAGGDKLAVSFETAAAHGQSAAHAETPVPAAPAPAEAQPLPADSPDALHAPEPNEQH